MALSTENKRSVMDTYKRSENDCGSPEVQVALLTERIRGLTEHFRTATDVLRSCSAIIMMVRQRLRMLRYLNTILTITPDAPQQRLRRIFLHAKSNRRAEARADASYLLENAPPDMDTSRLHQLMDSLREE